MAQQITACLYRPFDTRSLLHNEAILERPRKEMMRHILVGKNLGLATTRNVEIGRGWEHVFCTASLMQLHAVSLKEISYLFPLYLYPDLIKQPSLIDSQPLSTAPGGRRPNLSPDFIADFSQRLGMQWIADGKGNCIETFGLEDVFDYMYAVFHSPEYRERYAEFLKSDFPRLPLTSDPALFKKLCDLGDKLVGLHLMEQTATVLPAFPIQGDCVVTAVSEPKEEPKQGRVYINAAQYFEGVSADVWAFHIGGYQVCQKWLKDRKGRTLPYEDLQHYRQVVGALGETIRLMASIDDVIDEQSGWPLAKVPVEVGEGVAEE